MANLKTTPPQDKLGFQAESFDWIEYIKYRPAYPSTFFNRLYEEHARNLNTFETINDQGSGPGIAAERLAEKFQKVIVSEPNAEYVKFAEKRLAGLEKFPQDKFTFLQEGCEKSSLPDASLDCVTVCEALHWAHIETSMKEFARILKPGGTLGIFHYAPPNTHDPKLQELWHSLYAVASDRGSENEVYMRCWRNLSIAYQQIHLDPKIWKEGAQRIYINTNGDLTTVTPVLRNPAVAKVLETYDGGIPESKVNETDVTVWIEGDKDWEYEVDATWMKKSLRNMIIGRGAEYYAEVDAKIDATVGDKKVPIYYPVLQIIATRR